MARFYPLTIQSIQKETQDCVSLVFDIPADCADQFQFTQGQHLTLKTDINGDAVSRSYSICSSPGENQLRVAIKKVPGGQFSTFANEGLKAGDELEVMPPSGHFHTPLDGANEKSYMAIAAGSGITPIISIIKTTLEQEPNSTFILCYANKASGNVIFLEELEAVKNRYLNRFAIHHFFTRERVDNELFQGRIDQAKIKDLSQLIEFSAIDEAFICGPEGMMADCKEGLKAAGVAEDSIHLELFTSPVGQLGGQSSASVDSPVVESTVTIKIDGMSYEFPSNSNAAILDLANDAGADLPFSCKGGVCSTCKAKLVEGEVTMTTNYALEPDEIEAGYVLTCQSHPKTKKVVITFDEA